MTLVASSVCGLGGVGIIAAAGYSLRTINSIFGDQTTSVLGSSSTTSGLRQDVSAAVVFGTLFTCLAVALAWGAIAALTGTSTTTAVVANIITAAVLLVAVINVHPLFLLLMAAPVVAAIALLSRSAKDYIRRAA